LNDSIRTPVQIDIAFWLETPSHHACDIAVLAGFDTVILDMEHGTLSDSAAERLTPYCLGLGLGVYSRVATTSRPAIQKALDSGAKGVILPQIRGVDEALVAANYSKYPPLGTRGLGLSRIQEYGPVGDGWAERQNEMTSCFVMIETGQALADAREIANLPAVDGLFFGPSDMALDAGRVPGEWTEEALNELEQVGRIAKEKGKQFGTAGAHDPNARHVALEHGASLLAIGDDLSALAIGLQAMISSARQDP